MLPLAGLAQNAGQRPPRRTSPSPVTLVCRIVAKLSPGVASSQQGRTARAAGIVDEKCASVRVSADRLGDGSP